MNSLLQKTISIILVLFLSPIFVCISILILFFDGFPIFFSQNRIGINGVEFKCLKFRSMKKNAEEILKNDKNLMKIYLDNGYKIPE